MVQHMPQPFRHPKSGVYYFRKVVPSALRSALGKTEFRISLGTKDIREAKRRYPEVAADVGAKLSQASGGPITLTAKQIAANGAQVWVADIDELALRTCPAGWERDALDVAEEGAVN